MPRGKFVVICRRLGTVTTFSSFFDRVNIHFEGLFNGNKELGDTTNQFFNENWKDILKEIRPSISDAFNSVFVALINNVFGNIPYDDLFIPE